MILKVIAHVRYVILLTLDSSFHQPHFLQVYLLLIGNHTPVHKTLVLLELLSNVAKETTPNLAINEAKVTCPKQITLLSITTGIEIFKHSKHTGL